VPSKLREVIPSKPVKVLGCKALEIIVKVDPQFTAFPIIAAVDIVV